jgi:GTPase SAR1 family protein
MKFGRWSWGCGWIMEAPAKVKKTYHHLFKILLVGNTCVGKTPLVIRYADGGYQNIAIATAGELILAP